MNILFLLVAMVAVLAPVIAEAPHPLIEYFAKRIYKNLNVLVLFNGAPGTGKSFAAIDLAMRMAKRLGTPFSIEKNLDFNFKNLLIKMKLPENSAPGTVFVFEEVGAIGGGAAAREWQSRANAFFQSFCQTARHRNQILILNCPLFAYLEKGARTLIHCQITMQSINRQTNQSMGKPFLIQTNAITGKSYFKYLRYKIKGQTYSNKLGLMKFNLPPQEIINIYEPLKQKYSDKLDARILADDDKPKGKRQGHHKEVDIDKVNEYIAKGISQGKIAKIFGVSRQTIQNKLHGKKTT